MSKFISNPTSMTYTPASYIEKHTFTANDSKTAPAGTAYCIVKIWGAGGTAGNASVAIPTQNGYGGAGDGIYMGFPASSGDVFNIYMSTGTATGANGGAAAGSGGAGGVGGNATTLTKSAGGTHTLYAMAGGGGGGGGIGAAFGKNTNADSAGGAGYLSSASSGGNATNTAGGGGGGGGGGGRSAIGGTVGTTGNAATAGTNFTTTIPPTSGTTPPTWSPTGNGGAGAAGSGNSGGGGGGGGGWGGGAGGNGGQTNTSGGGGGAGGSFIYTAVMTMYSDFGTLSQTQTPLGITGDIDFTTLTTNGYAKGGITGSLTGGSGYAVIYFVSVLPTYFPLLNSDFLVNTRRSYYIVPGSATTQSIANNAQAVVSGALSPSTAISRGTDITYSAGIFTFVTSGFYLISAVGQWPTNTTGRREFHFYKNGGTTAPTDLISSMTIAPNAATTAINMTLTTPYIASAGDTIAWYVFQNSGGSLNLTVVANMAYQAELIF